ncbi:MAG TPA: hypothetical protein DEP87_00670 [Candidatus Pacebacteria bacterium]|nr:hypothetical protein [Candidatus Paceibacterota bacterium]
MRPIFNSLTRFPLQLIVVGLFLIVLGLTTTSSVSAQADIFGIIEKPAGVAAYDAQLGASNGLGLMIFFSNGIRLITIVAGLWTFVNFILAGFTYITASGDSSATKKVYDKITMSVVGLAIIVASYTLAGMVSLLLFGDATFILQPALTGIVP